MSAPAFLSPATCRLPGVALLATSALLPVGGAGVAFFLPIGLHLLPQADAVVSSGLRHDGGASVPPPPGTGAHEFIAVRPTMDDQRPTAREREGVG